MQKRLMYSAIILSVALLGISSAAVAPENDVVTKAPINPAQRDTGDVVFQFTAPFTNIDGMAWDGDYLWLACDGLNRIWKLDTLGNFVDSFPAPQLTATGLTWDGTNLWCADGGVYYIYKMDPNTGAVLDSIPAPGTQASCEGLAWMNDTLFNTNWSNNIVWALDPTSGSIWFQWNAPGTGSTGLTWDWHDNVLWSSDQLTDFIYKHDPITGTVITSFACPDLEVQDLAFDGTWLWTCGWTSGEVYKLDIGYAPEPAEILFVDDDDGGALETYFETSFANNGYTYHKWTVADSGDVTPTAAQMGAYTVVVWTTGDDYSYTLVGNDTTEIGNYLAAGGNMWLASQDVLWDIGMVSWMHLTAFNSDIGCTQATGVGPIMTGATYNTTGGAMLDYSDDITGDAMTWAEMENESNLCNTVAMDPTSGTAYRLFFNAFGFENINDVADRDDMMYRVIEWLMTGIEETPNEGAPYAFGLSLTMANPVNTRASISYTTSSNGKVSLKVYDGMGRLIRTLVDQDEPAGTKTVFWNARDDYHRSVANGVYFLKLDAEGQTATGKLILIK
jgi:hypothetical protein